MSAPSADMYAVVRSVGGGEEGLGRQLGGLTMVRTIYLSHP